MTHVSTHRPRASTSYKIRWITPSGCNPRGRRTLTYLSGGYMSLAEASDAIREAVTVNDWLWEILDPAHNVIDSGCGFPRWQTG